MIQLGAYQALSIERLTSVGFYLANLESGEEVLLPQKYITPDMNIGDDIEVFIYADSQDRMVATTESPYLTIGRFGYLKCHDVNDFGAFMEWGLAEKNLLVPFRNQARRMEAGRWYVVYLYEDESTKRLVGSSKVDHYLSQSPPEGLKQGDEVDILVRGYSEIGINTIVNDAYHGLLYQNEVFETLEPGERLPAYIKKIREDQKIDLSLSPIGVTAIEPSAQEVLEALEDNDGFLPFTDKSHPDDIREYFGMSKKLFKKAIGNLYKQRLVKLTDHGIYLKEEK